MLEWLGEGAGKLHLRCYGRHLEEVLRNHVEHPQIPYHGLGLSCVYELRQTDCGGERVRGGIDRVSTTQNGKVNVPGTRAMQPTRREAFIVPITVKCYSK